MSYVKFKARPNLSDTTNALRASPVASSGKARVNETAADMTWSERLYVPQIAKGVGVTVKHFFRNLLGGENQYTHTVQYPEEKRRYPDRFRGMHRLTLRDDGTPKCVACYCCATACPAKCIHIVAEEDPRPNVEKRPKEFFIDELRCIFCGMCVEACPKDAIYMDTGIHVPPSYTREELYYDRNFLLANEKRMDEGGHGGKGNSDLL